MSNNYQDWVRRFDLLDDSDRRKIRADIEGLQWRPKISVLMPVYNVSARWLELAIMSVRRQLYPHWELCIADDGSSNPEICAVLEKHRREDARIKVVMRGANGHISVATNSALQLATGEYVCFLDHDDELREHALYMIARALNQKADLKMLYSDEDHLTPAGLRYNPHFKSDWNPDLLLSQNYVCHLLALQSQLIKDLQGMRTGIEGAQDWDLVLRASERLSPEEIYHIPHVLYHWRVIEGSTAQSTSFKPYVLEAQQRVVREHLERTGIKHAQVLIAREISQLKVFFELPEDPPLVSVIIPTRDQVKLLRRTVDGVLKNAYRNFELLIIDNGSSERATIEYLESLKSLPNVRIIRDDGEFNFSRLNNGAVKLARGEVLGFLNNDLEPVGDAWLAELLATLCRPGIGAVGAKLLFPTGLIQHAGIILGIGGVAGHNHKGRARFETGYCNRAILRQNVSAVTAACMLIKRDIFERVGGFDAEKLAVAFNDVDLGLKIRQQGCLISFTPYAELYHYESASRGHENTPTKFMRFEKEVQVMQERWGETLLRDPYYNPNLTLESEDFRLAFPSRAVRPWKEQ
ncbi:MAG: glycosyltransferase family 2 protein [Oligoflexia bacterium]|nr:glycosyltransferase family 2 protein [Oligoflexia bacterium]